MKNHTDFVSYVLKSLLIIMGIVATTIAFVGNFSVKANIPAIFIFTILFTGLVMFVMRFRYKYFIIVGMAGLIALFGTIFFDALKAGLFDISNNVIELAEFYFGVEGSSYFNVKYPEKPIKWNREWANTFFICVILAEYIYVLCIASFYKFHGIIHIIISGIIVCAGAYFGKFPSTLVVSILMFYYVSCVIFSGNKLIYPKRFFMTGIVVFLSVVMTLVIIPQEKYDGRKNNQKLRSRINKYLDNTYINGDAESIDDTDEASGGIGKGKLGEVGKIKYSGDVMAALQVGHQGGDIYLKCYVGNHYEGNEWHTYEKYDSRECMNLYHEYRIKDLFTGDFDKIKDFYSYKEPDSISIGYAKHTKYDGRLFCYFGDVDGVYDVGYTMPKDADKNDFESESYAVFRLNTDEALAMKEEDGEAYREFYMKSSGMVPEEIRDYFDENLDGDYYYDGTRESIINCIKYVRNYLGEHTSYSLSPGKTPKNEDFILNFLKKKKKGYCSAYASAATMMFRYYGIPARYVEGYKVSSDEQKLSGYDSVNLIFVKDDMAHAWPEIYVSGVGFIPVEVTSGYFSSDDFDFGEELITSNTQELTTEENTTSENQEQDTSEKNEESSENISEISTDAKEKGDDKKSGVKSRLSSICVVAAVSLFVISMVIYGIITAKNNKRQQILRMTPEEKMTYKMAALEKLMKKAGIRITTEKSVAEMTDEITEKTKIDSEKTEAVLWSVMRARYGDENVKFSQSEIDNISKYVEEFKNCLQYSKNRL